MAKNPRILALFDVDGTLTVARKEATEEMHAIIRELRKKITIGVVGGSDFSKQQEQLGEDVVKNFDYSFSENGLMAYKDGELLAVQSLKEHLGEANIKRLVNFILGYLATVDCPVKRGTFIEFRNGMINCSPIGRSCSREERNEFEEYDKVHKVRETMVEALKANLGDLNLSYSIGGQISFDIFPQGWDKTFCLRFLDPKDYDEIHFFGDKTYKGGNDYEIYEHPRTIGHAVTCPEDTIKLLNELFP